MELPRILRVLSFFFIDRRAGAAWSSSSSREGGLWRVETRAGGVGPPRQRELGLEERRRVLVRRQTAGVRGSRPGARRGGKSGFGTGRAPRPGRDEIVR